MNPQEDAEYRLRLAKEHLEEAEKLFELSFWRASGGSAQLSVENSAKAVIAIFTAPPKTHDLKAELLDLKENIEPVKRKELERLADYAEKLGLKEHILTDYGDELIYKTPWEIYDENRARKALEIAKKAFEIASSFVKSI